ncbi:FRAS1-related extracellular matrix protein 3 isoform X1 [Canis lupus familiaris]|uniref:FRAS1-related extracellular matrix protein 3 isoform X1 n=1 Tax=Canis lupus familiaris TaxID=9615 RepID=UPI0018F4F7C4|nr:FRAS1-related extracellular matrix protein 3 isoform X1 [Canis lupus familiaris]
MTCLNDQIPCHEFLVRTGPYTTLSTSIPTASAPPTLTSKEQIAPEAVGPPPHEVQTEAPPKPANRDPRVPLAFNSSLQISPQEQQERRVFHAQDRPGDSRDPAPGPKGQSPGGSWGLPGTVSRAAGLRPPAGLHGCTEADDPCGTKGPRCWGVSRRPLSQPGRDSRRRRGRWGRSPFSPLPLPATAEALSPRLGSQRTGPPAPQPAPVLGPALFGSGALQASQRQGPTAGTPRQPVAALAYTFLSCPVLQGQVPSSGTESPPCALPAHLGRTDPQEPRPRQHPDRQPWTPGSRGPLALARPAPGPGNSSAARGPVRGDGAGRPALSLPRPLPLRLRTPPGPVHSLWLREPGSRSATAAPALRRPDLHAGTALHAGCRPDLTFPQPELVTRNRPWLVEKLRGWSQAIDGSVLDFAAPVNRWGTSGTRRCRLTLPPPQGGPLPRYGRLVDATGAPVPRGEGRDCEASVRAGVRYQHTAATPSPSWDYVPLMAELLGPEDTGAGSVEVRPREHLQLLVSIRDGVENTAPRPSFGALMTMRSISSC